MIPSEWFPIFGIYRVGRSIVDFFLQAHRHHCWGAERGKIKKTVDSGPSEGVNGGLGVADPGCHHEDCLLPTHCSEFCAGQNHSKIAAGLIISRSLGLKMKKLLDNGVDLPLWRRGGKK